ncbi:MAG: SprT family zinc-dependent metalloprotease [Candidatus Omnitrophota bacterium]
MEIAISKIIRTSRRSISFEIREDASLVIRAPRWLPQQELYRILEKKKPWIIRTQKRVASRSRSLYIKKFSEGEKFLYLGNEYPLRLVDSACARVDFDNGFLLPRACAAQAKQLFIAWYKFAARGVLRDRVAGFTELLNVTPAKLTVTGAASRWGSCTSKANINFSWRLVMAPLEVIDYVVVHELSHISIKNHSRDFWSKVGQMLPEYTQRRAWLKTHGHMLTI